MNRKIKNVTVLGSGVMGSRIACHFANIGCSVLLLDIASEKMTDEDLQKGLDLRSSKVRNSTVNNNIQSVIKSNPEPLYHPSFVSQIKTGNFDDDLPLIKNSDWIIEAVLENLEVKKRLFERVEEFRSTDTLITSNTSGIPINSMIAGRSQGFKEHFCGVHFFNPPRYLPLMEIIPTQYTRQDIIDFLSDYGDLFLGKTPVLCKDTPAFIANRVGLFNMMAVFRLMQEMKLKISEIDLLTGTITGKTKSATFRTADVVGIDTMIKVASNIFNDCPDDESRELFQIPDFIKKLESNNWLGDKTGQGFYKKIKSPSGEKEILELNLDNFEYQTSSKAKFPSVTAAKPVEDLHERIKMLTYSHDRAGEFLKKLSFMIFKYVSFRIPEIADELYKLDDAVKAGFGWEIGPFETWDILGLDKTIPMMEELNLKPDTWVYELHRKGNKSFYKTVNGRKLYYDISSGEYKNIPGKDNFIILDDYRCTKPVWTNNGTILHDIGDGILNLEFRTKMNSIGSEVLEGISKSIEIAEKDFKGLVIGNDSQNFSAGANLAMMFMLANEQEYDDIDLAVRTFQNTTMRIRYSDIPVVAAPHGLALGGGCEICLHSDKIVAGAETYIGLVEVGVGIIPAGGGSKEMTLRASDNYKEGTIEFPELQNYFLSIAQAKVSTSAYKAFELGIFRKGKDEYVLNRNRILAEAKKAAIELSDLGYTRPAKRENIKVLGRSGLASMLVGAFSYFKANYISEHDKKIAEKLAYVMCGGDLTSPALVNEQYLLDLEREAFLSLITEKKTLERIQSILTTGKVLRN
ncbi:MAG: 3-hydroxyacyl-CoA dehydrogenase/enoyl-CoA hydratase family protein [Ignavibacteriaceae bacterium]|nr:3-hydroxyacyl-CoA dehydrogenase/enoyl-CoA hydratase family protein [Ignavibacteriaceae bacterium]